ncbi:MAG: acetyl-CoA hydrolase/transferase C-terminal domain-containing protein, partial [Planctomycetaceae bacterium]
SSAAGNTPAALDAVFRAREFAAVFPDYPLGTEMTPVEQRLAAALAWLKHATARRWPALCTTAAALTRSPAAADAAALERLDLQHPKSFRERLTRRLVCHALQRSGRP